MVDARAQPVLAVGLTALLIGSAMIATFVGKAGERFGSKPPFFVGWLITGFALLGMALAHGSPAIVILASHVIATGVEDAGFTLAFVLSAVGALVAAASVLLIPGRSREPLPSAA